jgi:hypothetical protein
VTAPAKSVPKLPAGPYSVDEAIDRLLTVAASQIGYHEGKSGGSWNNDTVFGAWYGKGFNFAAWCASFVSWCADKAGPGYLDVVIPRHAYTPTGFNWFRARGLVGGRIPPVGKAATGLGKPKRGDIMYVHGLTSEGWRIHHVGIVENVLPGGYIKTVEANTNTSGSAQGDGVYRLTRKVTSRLFFASPTYAKVVKPRPKPAPGAKPLDRNGLPETGGHPLKDGEGRQILDLAVLKLAATKPNVTYMTWAQRAAAAGSLKHPSLALMPKAEPVTMATFRAAWKRWQLHLGYKGADADGIPGAESFSRFIERTGRSRKKSSGYQPK